jgi:hypothetical protein
MTAMDEIQCRDGETHTVPAAQGCCKAEIAVCRTFEDSAAKRTHQDNVLLIGIPSKYLSNIGIEIKRGIPMENRPWSTVPYARKVSIARL